MTNSSYADGGGRAAGAGNAYAQAPASLVLPARKPTRMHWSTLVMVAGLAVCGIATIATIAGLPAAIGYDVDGPAHRNDPTNVGVAGLSTSIDGNMKWVDEASSDSKGNYVGYIKSIDRSEESIAGMVDALAGMAASVNAIDAGLTSLASTTEQMNADMAAMNADTEGAARSMDALGTGVGGLSASMIELSTAAQQLAKRMAGLERGAGDIAKNGIVKARSATAEMNAALPNGVPAATNEDGSQTKLGAFDTGAWK